MGTRVGSVSAPEISRLLLRLAELLAPGLGGAAASGQTVDEKLAALALRRHQVGPLLYGAAIRCGYVIAPEMQEKLAKSYQASVAQRASALARLDRIAEEFTARGIGWMAIKGTIQAERLYADPAWRSSADIDLLVGPAQLRYAMEALEHLGYLAINPPVPAARPLRLLLLAPIRDVSFAARDDLACAVELHRRLFFASDRRARSVQLRSRAGRIPAPAPGPELALYLILHGAMSYWVRLKWLADLAALFGKLSWDEIAEIPEQARCARTESSVAASLILLGALFPFVALHPLESWLNQRRTSARVRRRLIRYVRMLNLERDWRASPLDNARLALESSWLVFEAPATRANIAVTAPLSSLTRKMACSLFRTEALPPGWDQPPDAA
jgi:Uncharacterised nucleotidyltransferase